MDDIKFQALMNSPSPVMLTAETRNHRIRRSIVVWLWTAALLKYAVTGGLPVFLWPLLVIGAYFSSLSLWLIAFPKCSSLTLTETGFMIRHFKLRQLSFWRKQAYSWKDCSEFKVNKTTSHSSLVQRALEGVRFNDVLLPANYGLAPEQLARLMNQWRKKALRQKTDSADTSKVTERVAAEFSR